MDPVRAAALADTARALTRLAAGQGLLRCFFGGYYRDPGALSTSCRADAVQRADVVGNRDEAVALIDVVELQSPDHAGPYGVDGGQGEDEPRVRAGGGNDRLVDISLVGGLQDWCEVPGEEDVGGRVLEDLAGLLCVAEQGPQGDDSVLALLAGGRVADVEHVLVGDFSQVVVTIGPFGQRGPDLLQATAGGAQGTWWGARAN
ncbi:hypothetical protein [Streptomyces sp. ISL-94]|uniref:hypothetical protein n=1 Tax=Streptomyces sp. ISL-94 TaxID=2819190 RepID=UPI001BE95088|nr:hypothetical protein [Streptomyces sp. ISL-94]MBT2482959.1 hypothetical protein [Streptomyces sp. ISL-94]